jgi:hypothetical protein
MAITGFTVGTLLLIPEAAVWAKSFCKNSKNY